MVSVVATITHQAVVVFVNNNRCTGRVDLALLAAAAAAAAAAFFLYGLVAVMFKLETMEGHGLGLL